MAGDPVTVDLTTLQRVVDRTRLVQVRGRLVNAVGPLLEAELPGAAVGGVCRVGASLRCEVVGFRDRRALLMPFDRPEGVAFGAPVVIEDDAFWVGVGDEMLGRVLDGLGRPLDGGPPLPPGERRRLSADAPGPLSRPLITRILPTGVRAIDGLMTLGRGQRVSIMAGSGVGKSTLLGMIAREVEADMNVICLVGERGREVREFIEHNLGDRGMARSVVVVSTSEKSPAEQVKATFLATTIAEYFRDQGRDVLLVMDSLTRLAMAQRQIGLAAGEPPTSRGFTPSVFSLLPMLLERVGPAERGSITGVYTVLVEGDDMNDPIGDAVRGIVDGHIVLSRRLASHGHYPAIDVLASLSRLMSRLADPPQSDAAIRFRNLLATWAENEELIRLGAYRKGSAPEVDRAIARQPGLRDFLRQEEGVGSTMAETLAWMSRSVG